MTVWHSAYSAVPPRPFPTYRLAAVLGANRSELGLRDRVIHDIRQCQDLESGVVRPQS